MHVEIEAIRLSNEFWKKYKSIDNICEIHWIGNLKILDLRK